MANKKNTQYTLITDKRCVPFNVSGTGTITTTGIGITGVGTIFRTELKRGAYIYNASTSEVRMVVDIPSDTYAVMESPFTAELTAVTLPYIESYKSNARSISVMIPVTKQDLTTANAWGFIDGQAYPPGVPITFEKANRIISGSMDCINPIIVDATGTQMLVGIEY